MTGGRAECGVTGVEEFVVALLASGKLASEIAGINEDGACPGPATDPGGTWVSYGSDLAGVQVVFRFEPLCNGVIADTSVVVVEDASDDGRGVLIWFKGADWCAR